MLALEVMWIVDNLWICTCVSGDALFEEPEVEARRVKQIIQRVLVLVDSFVVRGSILLVRTLFIRYFTIKVLFSHIISYLNVTRNNENLSISRYLKLRY